ESEVGALVDLLRPYVGDRIAMLVVPNHWGDAPIVPGTSFASQVRRWSDSGCEIFLHGFFHKDETRHTSKLDRLRGRVMTAGQGEFLGLCRNAASARIMEGRSLVEDVIGRPIDGFVAPAWLYGSGAREALVECHIPIAEDHMRVWSPVSGQELARGPVITW